MQSWVARGSYHANGPLTLIRSVGCLIRLAGCIISISFPLKKLIPSYQLGRCATLAQLLCTNAMVVDQKEGVAHRDVSVAACKADSELHTASFVFSLAHAASSFAFT